MNKDEIDKMITALSNLDTFIKNDERKHGKYSENFSKNIIIDLDVLYHLGQKTGIQNAVDAIEAINNAIYYKNSEQFNTAKTRLELILAELTQFLDTSPPKYITREHFHDEISRLIDSLKKAKDFTDPATKSDFDRLCLLGNKLDNTKVNKTIKVMKVMMDNAMIGDLKNILKSFKKVLEEDQKEKAVAKTSPVTSPRGDMKQ